MDDEPMTRAMLAAVLTHLGYDPRPAAGGAEAVALLLAGGYPAADLLARGAAAVLRKPVGARELAAAPAAATLRPAAAGV